MWDNKRCRTITPEIRDKTRQAIQVSQLSPWKAFPHLSKRREITDAKILAELRRQGSHLRGTNMSSNPGAKQRDRQLHQEELE